MVPPVTSDYKPIGTKRTISEVEVYTVGDPTSNVALICAYDIIGLHNNNYQICDKIAQQGFYVILPDFFRGEVINMENFKEDKSKLVEFGFVKHSWINTRSVIQNVLDNLKTEMKSEKLGIFGFCWGGKHVFDSLHHSESLFHAGVAVHPSMITDEDISNVDKPILAILTSGEKDLLNKHNLLKSKIADTSKFLDYTDQEHGFCASRGDFSDPKVSERVTEAIKEMVNFFKQTLN